MREWRLHGKSVGAIGFKSIVKLGTERGKRFRNHAIQALYIFCKVFILIQTGEGGKGHFIYHEAGLSEHAINSDFIILQYCALESIFKVKCSIIYP